MSDIINILLIIFLITMISFFVYQFYSDAYPRYKKYKNNKECENIKRYDRPEYMNINTLSDIKKRIKYIESLHPGDIVEFFDDIEGYIKEGIFASYSEDQFQVIVFFLYKNNVLSSYRVPFHNIKIHEEL